MRHSQFFRSATFFFYYPTFLFFLVATSLWRKGPHQNTYPVLYTFHRRLCLILRRQARREIDYFCIIHKNYRITSFFHAHVILENKNASKGGWFYEEEEITLRLGAWRHISRVMMGCDD
ncbi:hypothetical protein F4776DRAFT_517289 [Hypoxylon sp. NC0597]|nr:hypothetical protein F4776DRAFT_517289 [Hypoxylon sp. NC0597]